LPLPKVVEMRRSVLRGTNAITKDASAQGLEKWTANPSMARALLAAAADSSHTPRCDIGFRVAAAVVCALQRLLRKARRAIDMTR